MTPTIEPYVMRQLVRKFGLPEPEIRDMVKALAYRTKRPASLLLHTERELALRWWKSVKTRRTR